MKARFTYPVETGLAILDRWPLRLGDLEVDWLGEGDRITAVVVTAPVSSQDQLPTFRPNPSPGVAFDINPGFSARTDEVERLLRTIQGLMDPFGPLNIDFIHGEFSWVPESEEDRAKLPILSFSRKKQLTDIYQPHLDTFDMLARSVEAASSALEYEVPLSFLRRGMRDALDKRFIEAFYNFFFFLETSFAAGYSDPKKVKARFKAASPVQAGLAEMRQRLGQATGRGDSNTSLQRLLALDDGALIDHLVDTRGRLHHHAPKGPAAWHPDQPDRFEPEVRILRHIVHAIAVNITIPILFAPESDIALANSARHAGAILDLRAEVHGIDMEGHPRSETFKIPMIGRRVHRLMIRAAQRRLKALLVRRFASLEVTETRLTDADGRHVYAVYRRELSQPPNLRQPAADL